MNPKKPVIKILRSSKDEFLGAYPYPERAPELLPDDSSYFVNSVASAQDCTGIAVTIPKDEAEAASLDEIRSHPTSHK